MFKKLVSQIVVAVLGLWIAEKYLPGVKFEGSIEVFVLCGLVFGALNAFIKPILKKIAFPIRILTLGFFNIVINMGILWFVDVVFPELEISGVLSLFLTTCIISIIGLLLSFLT